MSSHFHEKYFLQANAAPCFVMDQVAVNRDPPHDRMQNIAR